MASEKRLIDCNASLEVITRIVADDSMNPTEKIGRIIMAITEAPTVDAVEVVHGRWCGTADGYADGELVYDVWNCSECDYCIDDGTDDPEQLPVFCPDCGARMDGG